MRSKLWYCVSNRHFLCQNCSVLTQYYNTDLLIKITFLSNKKKILDPLLLFIICYLMRPKLLISCLSISITSNGYALPIFFNFFGIKAIVLITFNSPRSFKIAFTYKWEKFWTLLDWYFLHTAFGKYIVIKLFTHLSMT